MPTQTVSLAGSVGGVTIQGTYSRTAEGQISHQVDLPKADAGTLTTRTSDTAGTLTMSSGSHGISTGDTIDIHWIDASGNHKCAYGATVGTVAGTSVPFTLASGDVLPAQSYSITADVVVEINADFDGDDAKLLMWMNSRIGHVDFQDSGTSSLLAAKLAPGEPHFFASGAGMTNPLTGNAVDKLYVSNGDANNASTFRLCVLYDSTP